MKQNGTIQVRLKETASEEVGEPYTKRIANIDKTAPTIANFRQDATSNSITITADVTENESGIQKCEFSKDGGATWSTPTTPTETSYTFTALESEKEFSLKMRVTDKAGNKAETEIITGTTKSVPSLDKANILMTPDEKTLTKENVEVSITHSEGNDFIVLYATANPEEESSWSEYTTPITMTGNGVIYARLKDKNTRKCRSLCNRQYHQY